ncbi:MAG: hypothetical protein U0103_08355 [Candidatus Obscuribacterales bacterium]
MAPPDVLTNQLQTTSNAWLHSRKPSTISLIAFELITATGIIEQDVLERAQWNAAKDDIPFGRALINTGCLGEGDLTSLLQAAQLVKQGSIKMHTAKVILIKALIECRSLASVIAESGTIAESSSIESFARHGIQKQMLTRAINCA